MKRPLACAGFLYLDVYKRQVRYQPMPIAQHLIGYLGASGHGVSGVEYACLLYTSNPMAAFGRLLSYREPRAAMCRAAFPSCGIPQGGQPTAWEYSVKRQWRGGMAAFLTFIILISGCSVAPAGSGAESRTVAPANSTHYEPPAFRNAEFHPDAAVSGSGAEIDLSAVSQGYVAVRAQSDKRLKCQVV